MVLSALAGVAFPSAKRHHAAVASASAKRKVVFLVAGYRYWLRTTRSVEVWKNGVMSHLGKVLRYWIGDHISAKMRARCASGRTNASISQPADPRPHSTAAESCIVPPGLVRIPE